MLISFPDKDNFEEMEASSSGNIVLGSLCNLLESQLVHLEQLTNQPMGSNRSGAIHNVIIEGKRFLFLYSFTSVPVLCSQSH